MGARVDDVLCRVHFLIRRPADNAREREEKNWGKKKSTGRPQRPAARQVANGTRIRTGLDLWLSAKCGKRKVLCSRAATPVTHFDLFKMIFTMNGAHLRSDSAKYRSLKLSLKSVT